MRNAYTLLAGRAERKKPLGGTRHNWENNIKMSLKRNLAGYVDSHQAVLNTAMNFRFPYKESGIND
jgi:hypothetical protein